MEGYFDYAATSPMDEGALEAYIHAARNYFANTKSLHDPGTKAHALLEHCRNTMAGLLGIEQEGVYFTSGGTESNELALEALLKAGKGNHIITTEAEHSSVRNLIHSYEEEGYKVTRVPLDEAGIINVEDVQRAIQQDTVVMAIQHVNSDIGTVQPVQHLSELCRTHGILFHSDCVQSFGKMPVEEVAPYVDSLSVSAHKLYGPKGVGAVYIRPSLSFQPKTPGGTHEGGVRAGTVNTPGIAGFTVAAEKMVKERHHNQSKIMELKQTFLKAGEWKLVGHTADSAVPIIGLLLPEMEGQLAMLEGNRHGFHFSTGSACRTGNPEPPGTLLAMGYDTEEAKSFIRLSFSHHQTNDQVEKLALFLSGLRKPTVARS
ncbi:aminotransferase class V-fold PLP-dependent enzyme [Halobacillus litoralis]|uniref:Aminotransferase class V-fold PLP-dependent enzyme n=1 Tax=Halobacillus litoralis TaxID=45668 RepID=A0A845E7I4_9BACI|nr:IscS subfamily cysteine desulfurase [Halobacillus litoralis]MYL51635.1 aminotransferase class V-fold PLP-dependent enzyme [Halobacillus litoralis]